MTQNSKHTIALIGGGTIAPLHAQYLLSSPTCKLVAIIDPFPPGKQLAQRLSVPHFPSMSSLLSSVSAPEAYIICVPSTLHVPVALEVLQKTTPRALFIEKPFSTTSASGTSLIAKAEEKHVSIIVGHHRRFHPALDAAKEVIASGRLGIITAVSGIWTTKKNDSYYTEAKWRSSRSAGGGPVWTNFVHDIDALHYLLGAYITRITVVESIKRRKHNGFNNADAVEEGAAIILQFENGVVGTFLLCDNVASPYGWESATGDNPLYAKATAPVDLYRIFGTEGTVTVPDGSIWTYRSDEVGKGGKEIGWNIGMNREVLELKHCIPFQRQTENLGRVIDGLELPRCSGFDGLAAVKVCEAVIEAFRAGDGKPVEVERNADTESATKL